MALFLTKYSSLLTLLALSSSTFIDTSLTNSSNYDERNHQVIHSDQQLLKVDWAVLTIALVQPGSIVILLQRSANVGRPIME